MAFFLLTLLSGCYSIDYDGGTRLLITGKIVDPAANPAPDQSIRVSVYEPESNNRDVISNGVSDASGNFKLVIPAPKNEENFISVEINKYGYPEENIIFDSITRSDFNNYKLDLGLITLSPRKY